MSACPVCGSAPMRPFLELDGLPVFCNVLWDSEERAREAPRGRISLAVCEACGMIRNVAFDPALVAYGPAYENSLHFSPAFRAFARELADRLIERYHLRGGVVVDIGCGRGEFLSLLCEGTGNRGFGFDPGYDGPERAGAMTFLREAYGPAHASIRADLVACRHVLEHLDDPHALLEALAAAAERHPTMTAYFEMPDAAYMLREAAIWDVIYEHPSYFAAPALARLFSAHGFAALDGGTAFGGQYLWIEAARDGAPAGGAGDPVEIVDLTRPFAAAYRQRVANWSRRLAALRAEGRRVALWGAGSKGVTFLNTVEDGAAAVALVVDVNERKQGRYVPGTGHEIAGPDAVMRLRPDVVLVMNRIYAAEIRDRLAADGVAAQVLVV